MGLVQHHVDVDVVLQLEGRDQDWLVDALDEVVKQLPPPAVLNRRPCLCLPDVILERES